MLKKLQCEIYTLGDTDFSTLVSYLRHGFSLYHYFYPVNVFKSVHERFEISVREIDIAFCPGYQILGIDLRHHKVIVHESHHLIRSQNYLLRCLIVCGHLHFSIYKSCGKLL